MVFRRGLIAAILIFFGLYGFTQQNLLPLHSFYKDHLFANKLSSPYNEGSFLPANEADYDLISAINDSAPQYYDVTLILFQKHLFEIRGKDWYITMSPAADLSRGRDIGDTNSNAPGLFQNTRGVHVEGDLFKNFSFSTSFYENQGQFANYQSSYFIGVGEGYPQADSTYGQQNAVIPGGARTKPFKDGGFDYAYAMGYFVYAPLKNLRIAAGNNMQFIGDGHRSLLLSDNSYGSPYFRVDWKMHPKFNFSYYRTKHLNLLRRPLTTYVEAYYQHKAYSVNYFTYKPNEKLNVSLFEGAVWSRGDSITDKAVNPMFFSPVPFIGGLAVKDKATVSSMLGVNIGWQLSKSHRTYAQVAMNDFDGSKLGFQAGYRGYNFFGLNDFMLQIEYNHVPSGMYETGNRTLNYTHYNLPLAHAKGSGFHEIIARSNYEFKRIYADLSVIYFTLKDYNARSHLAIYEDFERINGNVIYGHLELGYRFNRKMNLTAYVSGTYRSTTAEDVLPSALVNIGLRTGLLNHYTDF